MERVSALEPSQSQTGGSPEGEPSPARQRDGSYFLGVFVVYLIFFSLVGAVFSSPLPAAFGAFLFLTDGELTEWGLRKIGIRLVHGKLGPEFIKFFVFLIGLSVLLVSLRESAPGWLSSWLPSRVSWSDLAVAALGGAVLSTVSSAIKRALRDGIGFRRDSLSWTVLGFAGLGLSAVLVSLLLFSRWP
jgi:hypothetical protein